MPAGDLLGPVERLQGRCRTVGIAILGKEAREVQRHALVDTGKPGRLLVEKLHVIIDARNDERRYLNMCALMCLLDCVLDRIEFASRDVINGLVKALEVDVEGIDVG